MGLLLESGIGEAVGIVGESGFWGLLGLLGKVGLLGLWGLLAIKDKNVRNGNVLLIFVL